MPFLAEGPNKDENDKFLEQFNILYSDDFDFTLDENVLQLFNSSEFNMAEPETNTTINTGKMICETIVL
jgi:hypothetical protein